MLLPRLSSSLARGAEAECSTPDSAEAWERAGRRPPDPRSPSLPSPRAGPRRPRLLLAPGPEPGKGPGPTPRGDGGTEGRALARRPASRDRGPAGAGAREPRRPAEGAPLGALPDPGPPGGGGRSERPGSRGAPRRPLAAARPGAARLFGAGPAQQLAPGRAGRSPDRLRLSGPRAGGAGVSASRAGPRRFPSPDAGPPPAEPAAPSTAGEASASLPNQGRVPGASQQRAARASGNHELLLSAAPRPRPARLGRAPPCPFPGSLGVPLALRVALPGAWALNPGPGPEVSAGAAGAPRFAPDSLRKNFGTELARRYGIGKKKKRGEGAVIVRLLKMPVSDAPRDLS